MHDAGTADFSLLVDFCLMQCSQSASHIHPLSSMQPTKAVGWEGSALHWLGAGHFEAGGSWPLRSDVPFPQPCPWPVSEGFSLVTAPSPVGSVTAGSHTRVSFSGYLCQDAVLGTRCGSHVRNSSRSPQWVQTSAEHHVWHWYGCRSCRIIFSKITYRTWLESAN